MEFFRGLMFVIAMYFIAIGIYSFGYMMGTKYEEARVAISNLRIKNCQEIITRRLK